MKMSYSTYYNKVLGCWQGKCIGGSFGAPVEGVKDTNNIQFYLDSAKAQIANDDLDIQLAWVHALKEHGLDLTSTDLMHEWMSHVSFPWNEYGYAMKNFRTGIRPPWSGSFNNSYFGESMGCPIRSEIWGLIAPGEPDMAAQYAENDAVLDHYGNSVYAEKFLAAMEAAAFCESDMRQLLEVGLSYIPSDSHLAKCIRFIMDCHAASIPMLETRLKMLNRFGCPDATSAVQNMGIAAIGLLYGEGDFERSIVSAVNCGYDSDCTGATVGAILGIIMGSDGLPEKWVAPIGDDIVSLLEIDVLLENNSIRSLTDETCRFGVALSLRPNNELVIDNVPAEQMEKASAIAECTGGDVKVEIEYLSEPAVSFSEPANVAIHIKNNTARSIDASLQFDVPSHLTIDAEKAAFVLPPSESTTINAAVSVKPGITELPLVNKIGLTYSYEGNSIHDEFGLTGASEWQVIGPFWETFSKSMAKPCRIHPHDDPNLPQMELVLMNHADFDKEYLPEPRFCEAGYQCNGTAIEKVTVETTEDKVPLDDVFTLTGPQIVYLVRRIVLDQPRKVWMLTSGREGVKLWVNGCELINNHEHVFENPAYLFSEVYLPAGVNTIAAKTIRCGSNFYFSLAIKENTGKHWHQEQHFLDYVNARVDSYADNSQITADNPQPASLVTS